VATFCPAKFFARASGQFAPQFPERQRSSGFGAFPPVAPPPRSIRSANPPAPLPFASRGTPSTHQHAQPQATPPVSRVLSMCNRAVDGSPRSYSVRLCASRPSHDAQRVCERRSGTLGGLSPSAHTGVLTRGYYFGIPSLSCVEGYHSSTIASHRGYHFGILSLKRRG
jgi:hypothetical protein